MPDPLVQGPPQWLLLGRLIGRMNLRQHPGLATMTILVVAIATALATSIEIASRAVRDNYETTGKAILGTADLEIVGAKRGLPESLLEEVAALDFVAQASPIIEEVVRVDGGPVDGIAVHLLGIDLTTGSDLRELRLVETGARVRDPLRLLAVPNSAIVSESLADRMGLKEGDRFRVRSPVGYHELSIEGVLERGGLADAYSGQIAVLDVWLLQELLEARPFVDRIEIVLAANSGSGVAAEIEKLLDGVGGLREVRDQATWVAGLIRILDFAAWGIAVVGSLVAGVLAYAALAHVVAGRMRDLAMMQADGMEGRSIRLLVALDALILSGLGVSLGLGVGVVGSPTMLHALSKTSEALGLVSVQESNLGLSTVLLGAVVWIVVALAAGFGPARRAGNMPPLQAISEEGAGHSIEFPRHRIVIACASGLVALGAVGTSSLVSPSLALPVGVASMLLVISTMSGPLLLHAARWIRRHAPRRLRLATLIGTTLLWQQRTLSLLSVAIASTVAAAILFLTLLGSITRGIDEDLALRYSGGAAVYPGAPAGGLMQGTLLPATIKSIESADGVESVVLYHNTSTLFAGKDVDVLAFSVAPLHRRGGLGYQGEHSHRVATALLAGEIVVNLAFLKQFGLEVGDSIRLPSKTGDRQFRIGGVYRTFTGMLQPGIFFDIETFDQFFGRPGADFLGVFPKPGVSIEEVIGTVRTRAEPVQPLFYRFGEELARYARSIADRFTGLLRLLGSLFAAASGFGLVALLSAAVAARSRDLGLLQLDGATPGNVRLIAMADASLVVSYGVLCGSALGLGAGVVVAELLRSDFGWILEYRATAAQLLAVSALFGGISVAASTLPAWRAGSAARKGFEVLGQP